MRKDLGKRESILQLSVQNNCKQRQRRCASASQRAKFAKKVQKPPLRFNVINFELNRFNASIWVPCSPSNPEKLWCTDKSIQIHKMCKNKLLVFTYSTVRFTLRFVNIFIKVSQVCPCSSLEQKLEENKYNESRRTEAEVLVLIRF